MNLSKQLATILNRAMQLREDSYDQDAADDAQRDLIAGRRTGSVDFATFYRTSLRSACEEACTEAGLPEMVEIAFLLLHSNWNDVAIWIEQINGVVHETTLG